MILEKRIVIDLNDHDSSWLIPWKQEAPDGYVGEYQSTILMAEGPHREYSVTDSIMCAKRLALIVSAHLRHQQPVAVHKGHAGGRGEDAVAEEGPARLDGGEEMRKFLLAHKPGSPFRCFELFSIILPFPPDFHGKNARRPFPAGGVIAPRQKICAVSLKSRCVYGIID